MENRVQTEIVALHQFFQGWFTGMLPQTADAFARVADVLHADFAIISPAGKLTARDPLLAGLHDVYGRRTQFRIWIENVRLHHHVDDVLVATYEEWQQDASQTTARLSTVIFHTKLGLPNGLQWLHVHETWLDAAGASHPMY